MRRSTLGILVAGSALLASFAGGTRASRPAAAPSLAPAIRHAPIGGVPNDGFPRIEAAVESQLPIRSVKLYFRAAEYPDFHYVVMQPEDDDDFVGVLPIPDTQTAGVAYYFEALDDSFEAFRTEVFQAPTTADAPPAAKFQGSDPGIQVGKVDEDSPDMPPGFKSLGIIAFLGLSGTTVAVGAGGGGAAAGGTAAAAGATGGGGIGAGTAVVIGAAAAGAVGVAAATGGGGTDLSACFMTNPSAVLVGDPISLDASCSEPQGSIESYHWELGDGRNDNGRQITVAYPSPGNFNITLTISDGSMDATATANVSISPTTTIPPTMPPTTIPTTTVSGGGGTLDRACVDPEPNPPIVEVGEAIRLDARCSLSLTIGQTAQDVIYEWDLGDGRTRDGPLITVVYQKPGDFVITLTVTQGTKTDRTTIKVQINPAPPTTTIYFMAPAAAAISETEITSFLGAPPFNGQHSGVVRLNKTQADTVSNASPFQHRIKGVLGENAIEAQTTGEVPSGFWKFDFRRTGSFVAGSIEVLRGRVIAVDSYSVTFQLTGETHESIHFKYVLLP